MFEPNSIGIGAMLRVECVSNRSTPLKTILELHYMLHVHQRSELLFFKDTCSTCCTGRPFQRISFIQTKTHINQIKNEKVLQQKKNQERKRYIANGFPANTASRQQIPYSKTTAKFKIQKKQEKKERKKDLDGTKKRTERLW